jgi:hypothetical protein
VADVIAAAQLALSAAAGGRAPVVTSAGLVRRASQLIAPLVVVGAARRSCNNKDHATTYPLVITSGQILYPFFSCHRASLKIN